MTRQTAANWVAGREACTRARCAQIATLLGVEIDWLFDKDGYARRMAV